MTKQLTQFKNCFDYDQKLLQQIPVYLEDNVCFDVRFLVKKPSDNLLVEIHNAVSRGLVSIVKQTKQSIEFDIELILSDEDKCHLYNKDISYKGSLIFCGPLLLEVALNITNYLTDFKHDITINKFGAPGTNGVKTLKLSAVEFNELAGFIKKLHALNSRDLYFLYLIGFMYIPNFIKAIPALTAIIDKEIDVYLFGRSRFISKLERQLVINGNVVSWNDVNAHPAAQK